MAASAATTAVSTAVHAHLYAAQSRYHNYTIAHAMRNQLRRQLDFRRDDTVIRCSIGIIFVRRDGVFFRTSLSTREGV